MKTIFDLQTGVVTLLCTAALAGLTACEADPVMQESGKLPDKGSIEEVHVMLCSSNSVENRVDVLLTEGGVMTKNFYLRQTQRITSFPTARRSISRPQRSARN